MSVIKRVEIEALVASKVIDAALAAGFSITINDDGNGNGEDVIERSTDKNAILKVMFSTDDDLMKFHMPTLLSPKCFGWAKFIYGNDGFDVVSDYTTNMERIIGPVTTAIYDHYTAEVRDVYDGLLLKVKPVEPVEPVDAVGVEEESDMSKTWVVTRHGSNAANQSMTQKMILGTVQADTAEEAKKAAGQMFNCYANQFLSVESWSEADDKDCNLASDADQDRSLMQQG